MLLRKYKKVIARMININFYKNHHLLVFTFPNNLLFIKHLIKDAIFKQQLKRKIGKKTQFCNIFSKKTINIFNKVILKNYINCIKKNRQNTTI